jgi:UDP-3-O-[3-hydroxymyristoyl] glucosamine N-acyltransferase
VIRALEVAVAVARMFSGQVGIVGHLEIADQTIIAAQSGISKSITEKGTAHMGSPAFDVGKYRKSYIIWI